MSASALAQVAKWDTVRYEEMGFSVQVPAGSVKHPIGPPEEGTLDLYASGNLACSVSVRPTPDNQLASTVIEKAIQEEIKRAGGLGAARRWEQTSKQGDLFKGYVAPAKLDAGDTYHQEIGKIIGGMSGVQCSSMAPLGDDTAPILWIHVIGPTSQEKNVIAIAKAMAALVKRDKAPPKVDVSPPGIEPAPKPWPALKSGEIEIEGVVESVSNDWRQVSLTVDFVKLPGQDRIALSPPRSKQVSLRTKLDWITAGRRMILIGKNTGVGKPMTADVIEAVKQ